MMYNNGTEMTFVELLVTHPVVIPIIQRDYAQGRIDKDGQGRYKEVRDSFIDTLFESITEGKAITLDYIYGSIDSAGRFLPIDGQQRLTTLFLLHWYLAVEGDKIEEAKGYLSRFAYEVRDSALEFCSALTENDLQIISSPSADIKNAPWYYRLYDNDPTVRAMLVMLDTIHEKFKGLNSDECWTWLTRNRIVRFWVLTLEGFGLTDDLFIKMNARGKRLTRFESFKNEFESALDKTNYTQLCETWKDKIDNEWLDCFWERYSPETAEDCMFRFILFILRSLSARESTFTPYTNLTAVRYHDDIKTACSDENNMNFLIHSLDKIEYFLMNSSFEQQHEIFERVVTDTGKVRDVTFSERAFLYATFRYIYVYKDNIGDYANFERVLKNLVFGQRRVQASRKQYESSLDAQNFGDFVRSIDELVDLSYKSSGILCVLEKVIDIDGFGYLSYEIDKVRYASLVGVIDQNRLNQIIALEELPKLKGLIHNIFFDNTLYLTRDQFDALLEVDQRLVLRCIQSYSDILLLQSRYNGEGKYLVRGKVDDARYDDEVYYRKWFFGENDSDFGDYLLTSHNKNISQALKKFVAACSCLPFENVSEELEKLILQNLSQQKVGSTSYYFSKYEEFYGESDKCVCLIPYEDNYAIRTLLDGSRGTWNLLGGGHYNPYYMALKNLLEERSSAVKVVSILIQKDKFIEEWYPLMLSNGVNLRLKNNGNWTVSLNGAQISQISQNMLMDDTLEAIDVDCIEKAFDFIHKM